jgi:hypothetical protein
MTPRCCNIDQLEKLTYLRLKGLEELDEMASAVEREIDRMKRKNDDSLYRP